MCEHKKQKNEYNVLNSYVKSAREGFRCILKYIHRKKKKKNENFHDGNILTIFLIFWPFLSWTFF